MENGDKITAECKHKPKCRRGQEHARADGLAEDEGADERADDRLDARHDAGLAALDVGEALGVEDVGCDGGKKHQPRSEEGVLRHAQNRHKVAPVGDEQRAERGEHERPEHDGERAVVPQAEGRENRIERVEKCRTEAEQESLCRQRQPARENARSRARSRAAPARGQGAFCP